MKTARDLLLLSAVAFNNKQFDDAGALFATALSSADAPELLQALNTIGDPNAEPLDLESVSSAEIKPMSISRIAKSLSAAIEDQVGEASDEDDSEDEDEDESEDDESEDEDEDDSEDDSEEDESEDDAEDESVSTSSGSTIQRRSKGEPQLVISSVNSPIKLKQ